RVRPGPELALSRARGAAAAHMSVDTALQQREQEGRPIRVAMVGAGATGRAIALQLGTPVPGIRLAGIANRTAAHAERALREAGITAWTTADAAPRIEESIQRGVPVITDAPALLIHSPQ